MRNLFLCAALALLLATAVVAYKPHDFRKCDASSFCRRHRTISSGQSTAAAYRVANFAGSSGRYTADVISDADAAHPLKMDVSVYNDGTYRVKIDEKSSARERFQGTDALDGDQENRIETSATLAATETEATVAFGRRKLVVRFSPFVVELLFDDAPAVRMNGRNFFRFERFRTREEADPHPVADSRDEWEESFGNHRDTKPHGPSSVGMDIVHVGAAAVYGIPERATSFALQSSRGADAAQAEPYRLYNLDVFEFDTKNPHQPLYGAVPVMMGHDATKHTGVFWLNPSETFIDVESLDEGKSAHWYSESGVIDVFLFVDSHPHGVQKMYTKLTGTSHMPPQFAVAYHQCRWNYNDEADVKAVDAAFDEHDIPYDVIWLDIEHTNGKRYMTWDYSKFPNPEQMQNDIASRGRKMVTIVDPHLKNDAGFDLFQAAKSQGFYVRNKDGNDFEGHCWPGGSMWLDYLNPAVREYWGNRFTMDNYKGSTKHLYTWNDMNEPSVFNGPEITMPKDNLHADGKFEHRDVHNMYGFYMTKGTNNGHHMLRPNERQFILSRSFFAGSQRDVAVWTGDNEASWDSLRITQPMLLTLGMTGIVFSGADIGGFFKNPDAELLTRWYQLAAFQPFMRAHAHIETKRREPWLFGDDTTRRVRTAIRHRYQLLPYVYTLFAIANKEGLPVLRSMMMEFPTDPQTFMLENQFLLGDGVLVAPVISSGQVATSVYVPAARDSVWYDYYTGVMVSQGGENVNINTPIDVTAALQRGGSIVPKRMRARRSSAAMALDPFTLVVALNKQGNAEGHLYVDDGHSEDYLQGKFSFRTFTVTAAGNSKRMTATDHAEHKGTYSTNLAVERIVVYGVAAKPASITSEADGRALEFTYDDSLKVLTIRKPELGATADWSISIQ